MVSKHLSVSVMSNKAPEKDLRSKRTTRPCLKMTFKTLSGTLILFSAQTASCFKIEVVFWTASEILSKHGILNNFAKWIKIVRPSVNSLRSEKFPFSTGVTAKTTRFPDEIEYAASIKLEIDLVSSLMTNNKTLALSLASSSVAINCWQQCCTCWKQEKNQCPGYPGVRKKFIRFAVLTGL